jgi:kynurenine formamidase
LSGEAATWLVEHGAKMVGVDFGTPETAPARRWQGWRWPLHHALLESGVLVCENLTNLHRLADRRIDVMALALNIVGSDGAPARVIARPREAA